jgi:DNA-binding GntR family transcriptional regulator
MDRDQVRGMVKEMVRLARAKDYDSYSTLERALDELLFEEKSDNAWVRGFISGALVMTESVVS